MKSAYLLLAMLPAGSVSARAGGSLYDIPPKDINAFCSSNYSVSFRLSDKLHVKGAGQHPLYAALTGQDSPYPGDVKWNFGKFLIGRDGRILKCWDSGVTPESAELTQAIE